MADRERLPKFIIYNYINILKPKIDFRGPQMALVLGLDLELVPVRLKSVVSFVCKIMS